MDTTLRTLFLSLALVLAATIAVADWSDVFPSLSNKVLRLESMDAHGSRGVCSSAVINAREGYVLTAAHCVVGDDGSMTVNDHDASLVRKNDLLDLAVVRAHLKNEDALEIAPSAPLPGASVAVLGYALGIDQLAIQAGVVATPIEVSTKRMWMNVDVLPGDSGGVVVDADGRLVGITSAVVYSASMPAGHLGMAIPLERIREFIGEYLPMPPPAATRVARRRK